MKDNILKDILDDQSVNSDDRVGNDYEDELLKPLLSEIDYIKNLDIKHFVRAVLLKADNFWAQPELDTGYVAFSNCSEEDMRPDALVVHTKRAFRAAELLLDAQERIEIERDAVYAAILLQNVTKVERNEAGYGYVNQFYPYTVEKFVDWVRIEDKIDATKDNSSSLLIDEEMRSLIMRLIRCHLGAWGPVPETIPLTSLEWLVHYSDLIATRAEYILFGDEDD